jgi:hypothetical protein
MTDLQFSDVMLRQMSSDPAIALKDSPPIVVMSERHYLARGSTLILNGDIEDLPKFPYRRIRSAWRGRCGPGPLSLRRTNSLG